jgi:hypothetical protein
MQGVLTFKVAPIRNDVQVIAAQRGFGRLRHRRQLRSIGADVGDLVRDNQMVRGVDRTLHIVSDHA